MDNKRQQKFSRLIQKELGDIFQREGKAHFGSAFITVTRVEVSPDLGVARIYLSFMLAPSKQMLLEDIREKTKLIRQSLGNRIRHQARVIPELVFFLDETAEYAAKMDTLISGLNIPPAPEEDPNDDTYAKK
ncbi:MAG: Ribosome-binding factor A [uncultured Cytophagales bacterium]|uniref:Ribosome-binding factor A n=1 Tax=uncultured Cytophagales bacterium TaxID=158755 RepID=A0A6J4J332_9SPHI|nr:MAG: Ribosome-binding factor A [uncultured Cytophagales bacterium]